ncbi:hypothetical protein DL96DRAFT_571802 [Flagelloscypha sp. PMI_526]|nr:hypothetical protein DL96DRAFT_571802 [Flagelloscypha sp. PMI_526]
MENCQSWLHYYEKDPQGPRLIFQHSSLIFVTGVYQNAQWSLGAWSERHVTEVVSYSGTLSAKNELSGGWDPPPRHDTKHGPTERLEPLKPRLRPPEHPSLSLDEFSQASFVRGYVIGWRDLRNLEPKVVYPPPSWLELVVKVVKLGIPPSLRAAAESSSDSPRPPPSPPPPSQSTESVAVSSTEHDAEISSVCCVLVNIVPL